MKSLPRLILFKPYPRGTIVIARTFMDRSRFYCARIECLTSYGTYLLRVWDSRKREFRAPAKADPMDVLRMDTRFEPEWVDANLAKIAATDENKNGMPDQKHFRRVSMLCSL